MSAVIYPTTNLTATEQLNFDRGEGVYVYDSKGKQYLEGMAGLWCTGLGYGNQELIDTISEQLGKLSFTHTFGGKTHQPVIDLAEKLSRELGVALTVSNLQSFRPGRPEPTHRVTQI